MGRFLTLAALILALGAIGSPADAAGTPLTVAPTELFPAMSGVSYEVVLAASGGTGSYTFSVSGGSLPHGLSLSSDGTLSGVPDDVPGLFPFTVQAVDTAGASATSDLVLQVATPTILLTSVALPSARVGVDYHFGFFASGGSPAYTYAVSDGSPPTGLQLTSDGALSGKPTAAGVWLFTLQITDAHGIRGTQTFRFVVDGTTPIAKVRALKAKRSTAWQAASAHTRRFSGVAFLP